MASGVQVLAVIPSYKRPRIVQNAIRALLDGARVPDLVRVYVPVDDDETRHALAAANYPGVEICTHTGHGHIGPLQASSADMQRQNETWDWVYVQDDDACVRADTLQVLVQKAEAAQALGAGSRVVNYLDGIELISPPAHTVGEIGAKGQLLGGFHQPYTGATEDGVVPVQHLAGGSMLWRGSAWATFPWDLHYNRYIARRYEVYLGEEMSRLHTGPILYVPGVVLDHYPAPRAMQGANRYDLVRQADEVGYNWTRILDRYTAGPQRLRGLLRWVVWGDSESPGLARTPLMMVAMRPASLARGQAGLAGRWRAWRERKQ